MRLGTMPPCPWTGEEARAECLELRQRVKELEAQLPHWSLVSNGWPVVEGEYLTLSRGKTWRDPDPQIVEWSDDDIDRGEWTEMGITDYTLLADLLKLPGGQND